MLNKTLTKVIKLNDIKIILRACEFENLHSIPRRREVSYAW